MASQVIYGLVWRVLAGLLLVMIISRAEAQVYKWTDASGRTHYGNVTVPEYAAPVKGKVQVIDLRADNQAALQALRITERRIRPHYSSGAIHVLGGKPDPAPAPVAEPEQGRLRAVPNPFNAYAQPKPDLSKGFKVWLTPPPPPPYFIP